MSEILPFVIDVVTKTETQAKKEIYAFNTKTKFNETLDEIKTVIAKLKGKGFQFTEHPNSAQYIRFMILDKNLGEIPIHIDIPQIYLTTQSFPRRLLANEGIRLALLDLKVKLYKLEGKGRSPITIFAENILTKFGTPLSQFLSSGTHMLGLLPEKT